MRTLYFDPSFSKFPYFCSPQRCASAVRWTCDLFSKWM